MTFILIRVYISLSLILITSKFFTIQVSDETGLKTESKHMLNTADEQQDEKRRKYLKWKKRTVPYKISDTISLEVKNVIEQAMSSWNSAFPDCIEWLPQQNERDYVLFTAGPMCHAEVGRMRGKQEIVVNEANCNTTGDITHEMSHTVGFSHEHNRPDRDQFIKVLFRNIDYGWRPQYRKRKNWNYGKLGPYDYYSLMHYEVESPDRKKPAFVILQDGIDEKKVGQRIGLSDIDKYKIRNLYCPWKNME